MTTYLTNLPKKGPSFDFYSRQTVTWATFGHDGYTVADGYVPDVIIPFSTYGIIILLETASAVVEFSFNGTDVHGRLDSSVTNGVAQKYVYENRVNSFIWFRIISGSSPVVQVQAWSIR